MCQPFQPGSLVSQGTLPQCKQGLRISPICAKLIVDSIYREAYIQLPDN